MKELLQMIAQALVDFPERVSVREVYGDRTTVFELRVARQDVGKVIGKKGRNADAIRIILGAVAAKEKKRAIVEIVDCGESKSDLVRLQYPESAQIEFVYRQHRKSA